MEGIDKEKVQRIVFEMSKGTPHFRNEQRKEAAADLRTQRFLSERDALTPESLSAALWAADAHLALLERGRDLGHTWAHVDMDCFYAAVEALDDPSLRGAPFAVGGMSMISTASYEARRFGVRSAMPGFIAVRLCPQLRFVECNFAKYRAAADKVRSALRKFDPQIICPGLDEAYLDVTDACMREGCGAAELAERIRVAVREATGGLTCSAGVAPNRMLAKVRFVVFLSRVAKSTLWHPPLEPPTSPNRRPFALYPSRAT